METFIERLNDETNELDERIKKLQDFLTSLEFDELEGTQQSLLNIQLFAMLTYGQCLSERLFWLENED